MQPRRIGYVKSEDGMDDIVFEDITLGTRRWLLLSSKFASGRREIDFLSSNGSKPDLDHCSLSLLEFIQCKATIAVAH